MTFSIASRPGAFYTGDSDRHQFSIQHLIMTIGSGSAPQSRSSAAASVGEPEELAWFEGQRSGDEVAFEALFRAYAEPLYGFAYSYVRSQAAAQELVHDLFARLWERRETLDMPRSVDSYLFSAIRNRAVSHLRNRRVEKAFLTRTLQLHAVRTTPAGAPQELELEANALAEALDQAMQDLPPRCREVFALTRTQRLTYAQVADVLGISPKTVQIHMGRALTLLRQKLGPWLKG